jgi:hypothetical protein
VISVLSIPAGGNNCVFIRPVFDLVTEVLNTKISSEAIEYARLRAYFISDLYREKANKTELLSTLIRYMPQVVFAYSHGTEDEIIGPDELSTVIDLNNTVWLNGKITVLNACLTGKRLAQALVDAGASAVFAYNDELIIRVWADTYEPLEGFKECINKPEVIFDGLKAKDVYNATINEYNKWIEYWDEKDPTTADVLRHNRDNFALYGSGESRIALSIYLLMGLTDIFIITYAALWTILMILKETKFLWKKKEEAIL